MQRISDNSTTNIGTRKETQTATGINEKKNNKIDAFALTTQYKLHYTARH